MATTNFSFPGVTLNQQFEGDATPSVATLGTVCIGPAYKLHNYDNGYGETAINAKTWDPAGATALTANLPGKTSGLKVVSEDYEKLHVIDGVWGYGPGSAAGAYSIDGELTIEDGLYKITLTKTTTGQDPTTTTVIVAPDATHAAVDGALYGRAMQAGDFVQLEWASDGSTVKALSRVLAVDKSDADNDSGFDTLIVDIVPQVNESTKPATGATLALINFCLVADAEYPVAANSVVVEANKKLVVSTNKTTDLSAEFPVDGQGALQSVTGTLLHVDTLYFDYREFDDTLASSLGVVSTAADVEAQLGPITPENPLALALYFAVLENANVATYYVGVASDDVEGYDAVFDFLNNFREVYNVVPATDDETVIGSLATQVKSVSENADSKIRRSLWYGINTPKEGIIASGTVTVSYNSTTELSSVVFSDNTALLGYKRQPGDVIRAGGVDYPAEDTNGFNKVFVEGEIPAGTTEAQLVRTAYKGSQLVDELIDKCITKSYRAQCVWADDAIWNGEILPNYCLAAAAASMRSHEECWRPLSNLAYSSFKVNETHGFTKAELERLGAHGIWIIGNNEDKVPVNRKAITTEATNNINTTSESIVANADEIALVLCHAGEDYVGSSNISDTLLVILHDTIDGILLSRTQNATSAFVGNQLLSYEIVNIYQGVVKDEVYVDVELEPPKPFNKFHITMRVI